MNIDEAYHELVEAIRNYGQIMTDDRCTTSDWSEIESAIQEYNWAVREDALADMAEKQEKQ